MGLQCLAVVVVNGGGATNIIVVSNVGMVELVMAEGVVGTYKSGGDKHCHYHEWWWLVTNIVVVSGVGMVKLAVAAVMVIGSSGPTEWW